ncbi:MAG: IS200/IS605 family transposase [Ignavibacteria bacterium]
MPNTYSQIYIHLIFTVKNRNALIVSRFKVEMHKYIAGILKNQGAKLLAINSMPDHLHVFFGMEPSNRLSDLVRDIKSDTSLFINENKLSRFKFYWQEGYGAFSYSQSQKDSVIKYIINQEKHHRKKSFREEYLEILEKFNIKYEPKYLFDFFDAKDFEK